MSGQQQSLIHLSNSEINNLLNLAAYDDSFSNFPSYVKDATEGLQEYVRACRDFREANHKIAKIIKGTGGQANYSRCLFTNAFPKLGSLSDTLHSTADMFTGIADSIGLLEDGVATTAVPSLQQLQRLQQSFDSVRQLRREMERNCAEYETLLDHSLRKKPTSKKPLTAEHKQRIQDARCAYELQRFDTVKQINSIDCSKKLDLTKICVSLQAFTSNCSKSLQGVLSVSEGSFTEKRQGVQDSEESLRLGERIYDGLRRRLQSELNGYLAPPGSPLQALSGVQPLRSSSSGMPAYSCALTTELLGGGTASASYDDMRHALPDDGVYKQGFLFVKSAELSSLIFGGGRRRRWHRLYGSKLYAIEYLKDPTPCCNMSLVCDLAASPVTVLRVHGEMPFKFSLAMPVAAGGAKGWSVELQAENEDELLKWMAALRRCAALKGSPAGRRPSSMSSSSGSDIVLVQQSECASQLIRFVQSNSRCCECSAQKVCWISINLGATLCDECALCHRQLTFSVSRLKSIKLDEFFGWQVELFIAELGNERCNEVWERSILPGWTKPAANSPPQDKAQWIHAKYRWGAFVDDTTYDGPDGLVAALASACEEGSVKRTMELLAHQADVNCCCNGHNGASPLHLAVGGGHVHLSAYLAVNGADVCAEDFSYARPLDLAERSGCAELIAICSSTGDGFF